MHNTKMICESKHFLCSRPGTKTSVIKVQFLEGGEKEEL